MMMERAAAVSTTLVRVDGYTVRATHTEQARFQLRAPANAGASPPASPSPRCSRQHRLRRRRRRRCRWRSAIRAAWTSGWDLCWEANEINEGRPRRRCSAFGGSNTQGANAKALNPRGGTIYGPNIPSFAHLLAARLRRSHDAQWNADGGSGPMFAGACASHFIPPNTRLGTIEYLPNMGYIKEDHAEVAAVRSMLRMMAARGAAAFVVNIVSGTKRYENDARGGGQGAACKRLGWKEELVGCMGRERILHFRDLLARAANETGAHVVTIDADEAPHLFGADSASTSPSTATATRRSSTRSGGFSARCRAPTATPATRRRRRRAPRPTTTSASRAR